MASNRHLGRIVALQTLYEFEFRTQANDPSVDATDIMKRNMERYQGAIDDTKFVHELVQGVIEHQESLDAELQPMAPDWPINQIARMDRAMLRLGLFELLHRKDVVPAKVAINEAVELAKAFGSDNSSKFINGVLGTAFRTLVEGGSDKDATAKP